MPSFGMYTVEGTLTSWKKPTGTRVEAGEVVLEIETEKAVQELEAPVSGVLQHVLDPGARLQVESLIGYILAPGETPAVASSRVTSAPAPQIAVQHSQPGELRASPIAKRLAREHGIDLSTLIGTGPGGRIVEADLHRALETAAPPSLSVKVAKRVPLSVMRRSIGQRLRKTIETTVSLTLTREVRAEALVAAREAVSKRMGRPVPYDALFVHMLAKALRQFPHLNATIDGGELVVFSEINVGFAVAVDDGLLVPVIRAADSLSVAEIAGSMRQLMAKAAEGRLAAGDTIGGTATITNLGAYGIDAFTPVLNPPQAIVLGIGRIGPRPIIENGAVAAGTTTTLSLTFDHRVTDGAPAARLLDSIARLMADEQQLAS
jgi:pyruvate dehydrogenase E2 component (dihydrolipoamide acetyltransferase)